MSKKYSYDDNFTYVCDLLTWNNPASIRQAQLYCSKCCVRVNITENNIMMLPASLITLPIDKIIFKHSPIYGGQCLRPECGKNNTNSNV